MSNSHYPIDDASIVWRMAVAAVQTLDAMPADGEADLLQSPAFRQAMEAAFSVAKPLILKQQAVDV